MNSTKTATLTLWVTLTCLVGFGMFVMKNQVQDLENELASITVIFKKMLKLFTS